MATKKKEKTVQELLREKQLEQIENFSIDDGEEEHSLDQILEAASQQGLLELYNPFEERAKKIAEEEAQAPKRPSEAQTARQTFDQLGNLGNMVKKTETETLPKITNEAVRNYNLSKVGRDYLDNYTDSTSYTDVKNDIEELKYRKGGAARRDRDTAVYDRAIAMLEEYATNNYSLNDNKTSYADKEAIYKDNKQIEEGLGEKSNSATDSMYRDYALMSWLGSYGHKGIKDSTTNQEAIKSFNEATGGKGYDLSNELGELKDDEIASKADELRTYFQDKYGYKYNTDYLNAAQNFYSDLQNRYNKAKTDNKTYERTGEATAYTSDIVKKDDYTDKSTVGDYGTPTTKEDIDEYLKNNQAVDYNNIQGFDSKNVDSLPDKLGSFLSAEDIKDQNTSSEFSPERKIAINLQKTDNAWTHPFDTSQSGYDDLMTEGYNNGWDVISDEEKGAYYYIYNTEGKEAAYEYLNSLKNTLQKRKNYDNVKEATQNSADSGTVDNLDFILRSAASVPDNAFGGATGTLDNVAHYISGEDIEPYSSAHAAALSAAATREASGEALDEQFWHTDSPWGVNPSDIYGGVMSSADMLTSFATGSAPYAALMGLSAAESTARDLYEQGEDNATIAAVSTASGIAEALFEKLSVEQIWKIADLEGAQTAKEIVKKYAYNMARAAGVEASEEVATEAANMVVDNVIRGSRSDTANASIEEIGSRLYKAGVGGAIGGLLGGGGATTLSAAAKGAELVQNKSERNKYIASVGADVTNAGNTQALLDTADQMKDNAEVQAQAQKVRQAQTKNAEKGTESTAKALSRETGKLYAAIQDSNAQGIQNAEASEIKAAIKQAYAAETGEDVKSDTVTQATEAIYKSEYTGEKLTRAERNLASTSQAQSAVESVRNNPDLIEQGTQKAQERAFNKYISTAQLTQKQETKADEDVDIAEFNVHKDDGKVYTADGRKQVDIASVASIGENDITFALKDGQTESAKALDMPTKQAVLAQSVLDVQKSMGVDLTPEIANTLYKGYEQSDIKSVSAYMQDAQKVLFNGYTNNTKIDNTINLPQGLRNQLYSMGRQLAASHTQAQQQTVNNRVKGNKARKGSVTFVDGIKRGQLDSRRRAGVDTVENLAKSLGFNVVFYRSTKNGKGRYSSEYVRKNKFTAEGQQAPSGFWRGGKMYLDINAGMNGEGLILFTASHELVHMIREGSPEAFQELADFLVKNYAEQGVNINDLVLKETSKSTNLTRDEAFEEVIAESCETFLRDIHLNDKAQDLYKQNPTLWSRIREALKRIINSIKEAYAVARPQSEEARITNRADIETLEKAYDLWTKGIIKSAENLRNMERAENGKTRYSFAGRNAETADIGTLSDAILAEEEGATSEEIRKQTGWFRGLDGKWRFEIDDSDMKIKITDKDSYFISELVDHPQLFKAYPALGDNVLVSFFDLPKGDRGYWDSFFNRIVINKKFKNNPEEVADILAHEIQHVIQGYEDTALGASPKYWQQVLDSGEEHKTIEEKREEKKLTEQYEREREKSSDFVDLSGELFFLTRKYFFEDESPDYKDYKKIYNIQNKLYKEYGKEKTEKFQNLLSKLNRLSGGGAINDAFALYHRTAGEIEARDNTARRKLSTEQRKNTRPDIDRKDVVFAKYQSRVDDLFSIELSDDDTITNVAAREFVTHHEDMGEVLKNIADIDIEPKRVDSIINRVAREYLGSLDAEAKHTLSIEIQLALERVNNTDAQTISDTIIDAVRRAIEKGTVSDERAEADYKDLLDAFKGKKLYLSDEQINQLKEHDMTLDSFRKAMFGKMTIVKRENAKRSINGGYADAQQLSLEGLHDVLADADAALGLRSWQWDQENYDAPYIIKEAFDGLNALRNQSVSQVYSDQAIDDMAVAMSAKITGGIVEEKYKSKYKGKDSQQIRKSLASQQKQTDDYIANLVDKLMEKHEAELAEQKRQSKQKLSELKQKERERAEKRETELKKKYQEQRDKSREGRKRTELRHKIRNLTDSLQKRLTKPKGSQYVPRQLIAQTVDVLNAVNLDTGRSARLSEKLALLRNEYDKLKDREESYAMYDGVISNMLLGLNDTVGNTSIMDMTLSQLKQVYDTIRSMDHVIRESVKMTDTNFKHDAHQVGRDWIAEIRAVPKSHVGALSGYVQTMLSAERFFNRIAGFKKNSTSLKLFDMLNKGQLATTQYEMEFTQIFADLIQDKQIKSLYDTKNMVDIGLVDDDGNEVPITRGMMLSLYMHLQNEDNIRHVMGGGLTVPDMKDYYKGDIKKAFGKGMKSVRVGQLDYSRYAEGIKSVIEKQMTEYERGWIEAAHEFFDEASRKALNETTMKLYGFRRANVDNYFPIHTDSNYRAASFENIVRDMSLENSGFMKERVKASNPILLEDIVDVVNDQISKTAKYCGMTLPIKNFEKVYGTTTAGFETSVQKELNKKFSASSSNTGATKYIDNLLTDLTSGRSSDDGPFAKWLGHARGFLAQSTLTLNPRVAIAQTASVVTAAPVVGYKNITKALTSQYFKVSDEEIAEITPLFWLRRQGYATIEIGDIATLRKQKHKIQSKAAKALNWINAMDSWAVRRLFVASKYYMQENYSNLDPQSDEYKQKLSEIYNKVIEKTQPNYTVLQRPDILRNPNALLKSLTMFMTQRLQNFNIIYDSVGTFNKYNADYKAGINNVTADDVKEARSTLIRSITSQVASAATIVGMKLFADFLLHSMNGYRDDDDEITAESLSLTLLDNFADTVFGNILFASELYSAVKSLVFKKRYYGISLSGNSSIVDAITDIINLNNGVTVESVNKVAMSVCQVLGIPLRNAEKIGKAIYYWISDISSGEFMESGIERNTNQNIHRYETKLLSGDNDGAKKIVDEMLEKKKAKGKNDKDAKSDVRSDFTTEYKKRYLEALKSNNAEEIKNIRQTLYSSGLYGTLSDLDKVMQKWVAADKKEQSK